MNEDENQDLEVLSYSIHFGIKRESMQQLEEEQIVGLVQLTLLFTCLVPK